MLQKRQWLAMTVSLTLATRERGGAVGVSRQEHRRKNKKGKGRRRRGDRRQEGQLGADEIASDQVNIYLSYN